MDNVRETLRVITMSQPSRGSSLSTFIACNCDDGKKSCVKNRCSMKCVTKVSSLSKKKNTQEWKKIVVLLGVFVSRSLYLFHVQIEKVQKP